MRRHVRLLIAISSIALWSTRGVATDEIARHPLDNAALTYWQAFAKLYELNLPEADEIRFNCHRMPLDDRAREVIQLAEPALRDLHRAAANDRCHWGLDSQLETPTHHQESAQLLAGLACLRSRMNYDLGPALGTLADLEAGLWLAREVSADGTILGLMNCYGIEQRMTSVLATYVSALNEPTLKALQGRLSKLPRAASLGLLFQRAEHIKIDRIISDIRNRSGDTLVEYFVFFHGDQERSRSFVQACGGTSKEIERRIEEVRPVFVDLARRVDGALDEFQSAFDRARKEHEKNPMFTLLIVPMMESKKLQARWQAVVAMREAAIGILLEGTEPALKNHPDPFGDRFEYTPQKKGFELRSRLEFNGKPVSLSIGRSDTEATTK
jgi:hypothetical protein